MASERQREANRRNGRQGGPKTSEGKQRSRLNSLKHGLTSSTLVVLPEEDRQEYEEVLRGFRESLQPESGIEEALVLRLAQAHWRSLRSRCVETGMLDTSAKLQRRQARRMVENCPDHLDVHEAIGVGFMVMPAERWAMYLRYDATISRDFFRTLDTLTRLQRLRQRKTRSANHPSPDTTLPESPTALAAAAGRGEQLSDSGIRSVSQNDADLPQTSHQEQTQPSEAKEHKEHGHRSTPRRARRLSHESAQAPDRLGRRQQGDLRRLPAAARVLPRIARRAGQGHRRELGRNQNWREV